MAIEHFGWRIQAASQPTLSSKDTIRTAQFGDGYKQVSGSGLNDEVLNYAFSFTGDPVTAREIHAFLRRHKTTSFSFTPPGGELTLWRVEADSLQRVTLNKKVETVIQNGLAQVTSRRSQTVTNAGNSASIDRIDTTIADTSQAVARALVTLDASAGGNVSNATDLTETLANFTQASATKINSLTVTVNGQTAAINQTAQAVADVNGNLSAMYNIKVSVDSNGRQYAAGMGIGVENTPSGMQSQVLFLADRFAVMAQAGGAVTLPFVIQNGQTINGYSFAFVADGKFTCVTMNQTSDERVKFDKESVSNALDKICSLTGYTFGIQLTESESVHSAGIIAQDLEKVLPVAVSFGGIGTTPAGEEINDLKTVDYSAMSALYVEAMKELASREKSIESELAELKARSAI